jgi:hypothetical protein
VSEPGEIELVAAALRADRADVTTLGRVLTTTLGDTLPAGMVDVERRRSMGDRLAHRPGDPVAVRVRFPERELEVRRGPAGVSAEIRQVVRGVVISRREVDLDAWVRALAEQLTALAARDAAARTALSRLLEG